MLTDAFKNIFYVEIYAIIGFIIFFTFFIVVAVNAFKMKKEEISKLSNLPFDEKELNQMPEQQKIN